MPDEYISRAEALRAVQKQRGANRSPAQNDMLDRICCDIKNMPAVDVAPVVHCKECKSWRRNIGFVDSPNGHCFYFDADTNSGDFCSYGERAEEIINVYD